MPDPQIPYGPGVDLFERALRGIDRNTLPPLLSPSSTDMMLESLGSGLVTQSFDSIQVEDATVNAITMADGRLNLQAVLVREPVTVTGACIYLDVAGVFTGDNNNKIAVYQLSADGVSFERVTSTANSQNIWKTAGLSQHNFTIPGPTTLGSGIYFIATLANWSSATTAPRIAGLTPLASTLSNPLVPAPPYRSGFYAAQTDLAATLTVASETVGGGTFWVGLF